MEGENPYSAPRDTAVEASRPKTRTTQNSIDRLIRVLLRPAVWLSFLATGHFAMAIVLWGVNAGEFLVDFRTSLEDGFLWYVVRRASPAVVLLAASIFCLIRAVRNQRCALASILGVVVVSGAALTYEVTHLPGQVEIGIATTEFWESGRPSRLYYNWWWFNNRWLD